MELLKQQMTHSNDITIQKILKVHPWYIATKEPLSDKKYSPGGTYWSNQPIIIDRYHYMIKRKLEKLQLFLLEKLNIEQMKKLLIKYPSIILPSNNK
jgi:hypothetical protein